MEFILQLQNLPKTGFPVPVKALCYVDDWYKGFTVLTWYRNGEYYPGREKELTESGSSDLNGLIAKILGKYTQSQREIADQKTFEDVFKEFYLWKFKKEYTTKREKRTSSERSYCAPFKNCSKLHKKPFRALTTDDLQKTMDECAEKGLKHSSLELVKNLYVQMYKYADANDLCDKKYSDYVKIGIPDDDEHGVPFSDEDLKILWTHKENDIVKVLLINCYSGFRISEFINLEINLEERYFHGGLKTDAGKNRYVPIHSAIFPLVEYMVKKYDRILFHSVDVFREKMYETLDVLGIEKHTPHDCRHTFNKLCDQYEVNDRDKKLMIGHAFSDITNKVYLHRSIKNLSEEIEKIQIP